MVVYEEVELLEKSLLNKQFKVIENFQKRYPTREAKEEALRKMADKEIDHLIMNRSNLYGKIVYYKFKLRK